MIAPIALISTEDVVDKGYNYIDTTRTVIESNLTIFKLKEKIVKQVYNDILTLEGFMINTEKDSISLKVKGNGK